MPQLLTEAVGGTAIEVFVQQDPRPYRHAQGAFRDQPRRGRCRHHAWDLRALTRLLVALALDAPHVALNLDFNNGRLFGTGHRPQRLTTAWAVFRGFAHVMHFGDHWQGETITAPMPRAARLLAPLAGTGRLGRASTVRAPQLARSWR